VFKELPELTGYHRDVQLLRILLIVDDPIVLDLDLDAELFFQLIRINVVVPALPRQEFGPAVEHSHR
jgi:hypothetical protein